MDENKNSTIIGQFSGKCCDSDATNNNGTLRAPKLNLMSAEKCSSARHLLISF